MPSEPSVATRAFAPLVQRLAALGVDVQAFLHRRGIPPESLHDDLARVPLSQTDGMWEEAAQLAGDPAFGLHLAEGMQASSFGLFSYLAVASATWGFALERVTKFFGLISDAAGYDITREGDEISVRARPWGGRSPTRQIDEFSLAVMVNYGRGHLAEPLRCTRVCFPHAAPTDTTPHEQLFGVRVDFGAPFAAFSFERRFLDVSVVSADDKLATLLQPQAEAELASLSAGAVSRVEQVRTLLAALLQRETPTLESAARRLGLSSRTLQRELAASGTSFRELLGQARSEWAGQLLLDRKLSVGEVAVLLGFSEVAAFHRSFKRWTGRTPGEHRRESGARP